MATIAKASSLPFIIIDDDEKNEHQSNKKSNKNRGRGIASFCRIRRWRRIESSVLDPTITVQQHVTTSVFYLEFV